MNFNERSTSEDSTISLLDSREILTNDLNLTSTNLTSTRAYRRYINPESFLEVCFDYETNSDLGVIEHQKATWIDMFLFFFCACGATMCPISLLSCIVTYGWLYGDLTYMFLGLVIYLPLLPIFCFKAGGTIDFCVRGFLGFLFSLLIVTAPYIYNLSSLLLLAALLGTCMAYLQGSLLQMASIVSGCGRLKVSVLLGSQFSGEIVLITSLITSFGHDEDEYGKYYFFYAIAILESVSFFIFLWIMYKKREVLKVMFGQQKDCYERENIIETNEFEESYEEISYSEILRSTWRCCLSIIITTLTTHAIWSWFNEVKTDWTALPQILFFVRLFSDLLGRLAFFCEKDDKS